MGPQRHTLLAAALETEQATAQELRRRIELLLASVGDKSRCRGCGAEIYWLKTRAGKRAPYDGDGVSHFATCPEAKRFRVGKQEG